jgi:Flp pilus assembly protein TadB
VSVWVVVFAVGTACACIPFGRHWMHILRLRALHRAFVPIAQRASLKRTFAMQFRWRSLENSLSMIGSRWSVEAVVVTAVCIGGGTGWIVQRALDALIAQYAGGSAMFVAIACGIVASCAPFVVVALRVQRVRHAYARACIQLVSALIGHYRMDMTVMDLISMSADAMPPIVQSEWRRLEMRAMLYGSLEDALSEFARRMDNAWAENIADVLVLRHQYGHDIAPALHKIMADMQQARKYEEKRMAAMTLYRLGTLGMIGFAVFTVIFNIAVHPAHSTRYFGDPFGVALIVGTMIVMGLSLVLVLRSGNRPF